MSVTFNRLCSSGSPLRGYNDAKRMPAAAAAATAAGDTFHGHLEVAFTIPAGVSPGEGHVRIKNKPSALP